MIRSAIAGMALMTGAGGAAASDQTAADAGAAGERQFAERMLERMRAAGSRLDLRVSERDPLVIEVTYEGAREVTDFDLRTFHRFCTEATAEECEALLETFVSRAVGLPPAAVAANLRIVVRHRDYLEHLVAALPPADEPMARQIGDDLFALLAFASDEAVAVATPGQVRALGIEIAAAWDLAHAQTRAALPALPVDIDLAEHVIGYEDYMLLPSLLADTESWRGIAGKAGPDLFATATSDLSVWVGVMPDGPRFDALKKVVRSECAALEACVSPNVYRFRGGRWVAAD